MARRVPSKMVATEAHDEAGGAGRILEEYLSELKAIHASGAGVAETSYYPALSNLFNAVGKTLKPKVRCLMTLKNNPKDVAWFLASYARDALFRVEHRKELPALQTVRSALEEALGDEVHRRQGRTFLPFHAGTDPLLWRLLRVGPLAQDNPVPQAKFDWRTSEWSLHVPFIRALYGEVAKPNRLGPLGLVELLDWAGGVLNRVDRGDFRAVLCRSAEASLGLIRYVLDRRAAWRPQDFRVCA